MRHHHCYTGLRDSAMLTEDENIVEICRAIPPSDTRAHLFESKDSSSAVVQAAEIKREVVGKMMMDSVLAGRA
jgi:membrane protease subunit HflK